MDPLDIRVTLNLIKTYGVRGPIDWFGPNWRDDFFYLRHIAPGHWVYMGHRILRVENPDAEYKCDRFWWILERISDGRIFDSKIYRTKDGQRWRLFNNYVELANMVVQIEDERKTT